MTFCHISVNVIISRSWKDPSFLVKNEKKVPPHHLLHSRTLEETERNVSLTAESQGNMLSEAAHFIQACFVCSGPKKITPFMLRAWPSIIDVLLLRRMLISGPRSFALYILVNDPLLVTSYQPLKKKLKYPSFTRCTRLTSSWLTPYVSLPCNVSFILALPNLASSISVVRPDRGASLI